MVAHRNNGILWTCEIRIKWTTPQWHGTISTLFCWVKNTEGNRINLECSPVGGKEMEIYVYIGPGFRNLMETAFLCMCYCYVFTFPSVCINFFSWRKRMEKEICLVQGGTEKAADLGARGTFTVQITSRRFFNLSNPVAGRTTSLLTSQYRFAPWECSQSFIWMKFVPVRLVPGSEVVWGRRK